MYSEYLESLIDAAIADGILTDQERAILHKKALAEGVDPDELDMVINGRLAKKKKQEAMSSPAQPKESVNQKLGNVLKCPSCGAQVVAGSAVCPECGYAFTNVMANSSIERLQEKLDEFNRRQEERQDDFTKNRTDKRSGLLDFDVDLHATNTMREDSIKGQMKIITTFPVPNTRADLLEFMAMLLPMANSAGPKNGQSLLKQEEDLSYAYWLLFVNCINKARISFSKDPDFGYYFTKYDEESQKPKGINRFFGNKIVRILFISIGGLLLLIFLRILVAFLFYI